jgi:hypothetical protein
VQKTEIQIDAATGAYFETASGSGGPGVGIHELGPAGTGQRKKLKKAEISLNDCLACSYVLSPATGCLVCSLVWKDLERRPGRMATPFLAWRRAVLPING